MRAVLSTAGKGKWRGESVKAEGFNIFLMNLYNLRLDVF